MINLFIALLISQKLFAASCCGGGSSSSMIITSDNRREISLGFSARTDIGQTDQNGWSTFNNDQIIDSRSNFNLQYGEQLAENFQLGLKTSIAEKHVKKSGKNEKTQGFTDLELQTTYEYLPEYTYHPYKPRGFLYTKLSIPLSKSIYNSQSSILSDVRGSGLYSASLGNFFMKKFDLITLKVGLDFTRSLAKKFSEFKIYGFNRYTLPLGIAYAFNQSDYSLGFTNTFSYTEQKKFRGNNLSNSHFERFWDSNIFLNYSPNRQMIYGISYSDSSLFGESINSPLYRSVALNYTYAQEI
jgi:hypothetical protein